MALSAAMVLSGLQQEHFLEDTRSIFNYGTPLLKSPSTSPASKSVDITLTEDNGDVAVSCSSSLSVPKMMEFIMDVISALEERFKKAQRNMFNSPVAKVEIKSSDSSSSISNSRSSTVVDVETEKKIIYQKRDILNLADNILTGWSFQYAAVTCGSSDHSENDSQEAELPGYLKPICNESDCRFPDPMYFIK